MTLIKSSIFALMGLASCPMIVTAAPVHQNIREQQIEFAGFVGNELCALDDTFYIAIKNIQHDGGAEAEQRRALLTMVQYHVQTFAKEFLSSSNQVEAQHYAQEFARRLTNQTPNIKYDLQTKNDFSGFELLVLDCILADGCQQAVEADDIETLFLILCIRCSILKESAQLLLASSHENAQEIRTEVVKRLAHCTKVQHTLLQELHKAQAQEAPSTQTA